MAYTPSLPSSLPLAQSVIVPAHILPPTDPGEAWTPKSARRPALARSRISASHAGTLAVAYERCEEAQELVRRGHSIQIGRLRRSQTTVQRDIHGDRIATTGRAFAMETAAKPSDSFDSKIPGVNGLSFPKAVHTRSRVGPGRQELVVDQAPFQNARLSGKLSSYDLEKASSASRQGHYIEPYHQSADPTTHNPSSARRDFAENPFADHACSSNGRSDMSRFSIDTAVEDEEPWLSRTFTAPIKKAANGTLGPVLGQANAAIAQTIRESSGQALYEKAKVRGQHLQRSLWARTLFEWSVYAFILAFIYFVLVGLPLWNGSFWWLYWAVANKFVVAGFWSITIGLAIIYAYLPLTILFEEPQMPDEERQSGTAASGPQDTALLIPCYKSADIIGPTLMAAVRIFPASHIFVVANGNSPKPIDDTEQVCLRYGVNHIWSPLRSQMVAQFVGCHACKKFKTVLLINDDCTLPSNFPIVSDRIEGKTKCIGYATKSVGPGSTKGSYCQQAQDLEYKLSSLSRALAGKVGSATFPRGAISLWNTNFLITMFNHHPGFSVSEDWFFGHQARALGSRVKMCTSVFVERHTPSAIFFSARDAARGGSGEVTIFQQRLYRWNFFFHNGLWFNLRYLGLSWKLGFWEIGAKLFALQDISEALLYLLAPFVLPASLLTSPAFCGYLLAATLGLYYINVLIFNELHLRLRNERVALTVVSIYYPFYQLALVVVDVSSCYYSLYRYAKYFATRHPRVVEDEKLREVVLKLEEQPPGAERGRRLKVTAVESPLT